MSRERIYETDICAMCAVNADEGDPALFPATIWWRDDIYKAGGVALCDGCAARHSVALLCDVVAGGRISVGEILDDLLGRVSLGAQVGACRRNPYLMKEFRDRMRRNS